MTDTPDTSRPVAHPVSGWVVVVSPGSVWAKCYGTFADYDATVAWVRANGWHPSETHIHPVSQVKQGP